jgi:glycopeptide antibiotics resistance protein
MEGRGMGRMYFWMVLGVGAPIWLYARWNRYKKQSRAFRHGQEVLVNGFFVYVLSVVYLTLFSHSVDMGIHPHTFNWIPLVEMKWLLYRPEVAWMNIAGNILMFIPLGVLLPMMFRGRLKMGWMVCIGLICSFAIECVQCWMGTRNADIDDVLLNTMGAVVGFVVYRTGRIIKEVQYWSLSDERRPPHG